MMISLQDLIYILSQRQIAVVVVDNGQDVALCDPDGKLGVFEIRAFEQYRGYILLFFNHMHMYYVHPQESLDFLQRYKSMPYAQYLKTEHWQQMRKAKLIESQRSCQLCNSEDNLHIHHRTYERLGREHLSDLIALCASCHSTFHQKQRQEANEETRQIPGR